MKPYISVKKDFTKEFNDIVKKFKRDAVLVGIPETDNTREEDQTGEIGNAALLALLNFGSPLNNIPAWPIMSMGIRESQEDIAEQFKQLAKNVLSLGFGAFDIYYNRTGIIASTSIKKVINSQEDAPELAEATLAARKRAGFKGTKRGIVTGQMRNAITYVLRGEG